MESQITLKSRGNLPDSHPCFLQYTGKPSGFRRIPDKCWFQLGTDPLRDLLRLGLACILYYSNSPFPEGLLRSAITVGMVDCRIPQSGLILGAAHWPHKFQHCTPPILSTCEPFPTMGIPGLLSRILVVASGSHIDGSHGASTALCNPYYLIQ